jgi:Mg-chelatase subunit ChlD
MATDEERLRRWRLILGGHEADGVGCSLGRDDEAIDRALAALYDGDAGGSGKRDNDRRGNLGSSAPSVARWLGDIRSYFPTSVVRRVVEELERRLVAPTRQAILGSLNRAVRNRRPRHNEIDWHRTIRANLKHYQPEYRTIIPETRIGYGRKRSALRDITLCVDQSGSMATSVVYAGIFAAVLASLPAVQTRLVVFDTAVVDLTDQLDDPVEVLFGTQLGGGTDINQALAYCQSLLRQPQDTILVLISDLYEGGNAPEMLKRAAALVASGVQVIALLALNDDGAPSYDHGHAAALAGFGVPAFACTPDLFPELMAAAINRQDIGQWAAAREIVTARGEGT